MSEEIKIDYGPVSDALSEMKSSAQTFRSSLPKDFASGNLLEAVKKIEALHSQLQESAEAYKNLLLQNIEATEQSVQAMKEKDEKLAASIK